MAEKIASTEWEFLSKRIYVFCGIATSTFNCCNWNKEFVVYSVSLCALRTLAPYVRSAFHAFVYVSHVHCVPYVLSCFCALRALVPCTAVRFTSFMFPCNLSVTVPCVSYVAYLPFWSYSNWIRLQNNKISASLNSHIYTWTTETGRYLVKKTRFLD